MKVTIELCGNNMAEIAANAQQATTSIELLSKTGLTWGRPSDKTTYGGEGPWLDAQKGRSWLWEMKEYADDKS